MNRIATTILLVLAAAFLLSCGGGSSTPADQLTPADSATPAITPEAPSEVIGDHSTSVVENQVNVLTGATPAELTVQLEKFGMTGISKNGGWATVELPAGTDLDWAVATLKKEYNIAKAEKINVLHTPHLKYEQTPVSDKNASFTPYDPGYAMRFVHLGWSDADGSGTIEPSEYGYSEFFGQSIAMDPLNYPAAWDVALNPGVAAQPVRIAIIDGGFFNYDDWTRGSFDETQLDGDVSGFVDSDGTVTTGFTAAEWYLDDDGDPATLELPIRTTGELMLGMLADTIGDPAIGNGFTLRAFDFDESGGDLGADEIWNEGIAGCNPSAEFILLKTGEVNVDTWQFTDNHIASAIDYAAADPGNNNGGLWPNGGCGADIILLGMFAKGAVGANVSTAIQTARDNNCLVIAPAGDVVWSVDFEADPIAFTDTVVDITVDPVTPASDPNCIAVSGTGINPPGNLGQIDIGGGTMVDNLGIGWLPNIGGLLDSHQREVASYCNSGGDLSAIGFGHGWDFYWFITGDGTALNPTRIQPGVTWRFQYERFGSVYAAAYVAGAASIVHQALNQANGSEPTDDDVWQVLIDNQQFAPIPGVAGGNGMLDAGKAAYDAMSGGNLYQPSMYFTGLTISQPPAELEPGVGIGFSGVVRGTTFEAAPSVDLGTAPFTLTVDWDNGDPETVVDPWVNGDPVTLLDGWDTLGQKGVNITVADAAGQEVNWAMWVNVVNPISAGITFEATGGEYDPPTALSMSDTYRFNANLTNVYTGLIDGNPNELTFTWDFGDGSPQKTNENPTYKYGATGSFTVQLLVQQSLLPDRLFTVDVTVGL